MEKDQGFKSALGAVYQTFSGEELYDFDRLAERVAELFVMPIGEVLRKGRYARTVPARSVLCYWANRELGISTVELARRLKIAQSTLTQSVERGGRIVDEKRISILDE